MAEYKPLPQDHPFRRHAENLRAVKHGLKQAERAHKAAIRAGDDPAIEFAGRMHLLVASALAEAMLRKTIWDPAGFNERERNQIVAQRSQLDRWSMAIELAVRRQYGIPFHVPLETLDAAEAHIQRIEQIQSILHSELKNLVSERNDIAHAQWAWLLNSKEKEFTGRAPGVPNYLATRRRREIVELLGRLVHVLATSEPTFQRDYDEVSSKIVLARKGLAALDYGAFADGLRRGGPSQSDKPA
ncbi:hypothetical protein [Promicromonospora sp. NPDC019610]|uniref:hypothetical protein n=1 Tax=Promicromonospora sp. NPDC019610 TaxID=3364405 RepID=UPI00378BE581